jgi:hypothetical protein
VASHLEVGTGFHPELSGRENVSLNGAILGMSKSEIRKKFDEIVAFAEVEKFIDTPVKRYSSGMYVRLAFAVAAHLEPEILIVDEVLAVVMLNFRRNAWGKWRTSAGKEGPCCSSAIIWGRSDGCVPQLCGWNRAELKNEAKLRSFAIPTCLQGKIWKQGCTSLLTALSTPSIFCRRKLSTRGKQRGFQQTNRFTPHHPQITEKISGSVALNIALRKRPRWAVSDIDVFPEL